jgi:hypothetical protein
MSEMKKSMDTTNNSTVYNRYRKNYLEKKGEIHCSYCQYHRGENRVNWHGGFIEEGESLKDSNITYPSWKLASKNRKQWMPKNYVTMTIEPPKYSGYRRKNWEYVSFQIGDGRYPGIKYYKR